MHNVDLAALTIEDLAALEQDIKAERRRREEDDRQAFYEQAKALAERHGIPMKELMRLPRKNRQPRKKEAVPRQRRAANYQNPDNAEETWNGRGRQPEWVKAKRAEGVPLDALEG